MLSSKFANILPSRNNKARRRSNRGLPVAPVLECLESRQLLTSSMGDFNGDGFDDLAVGIPSKDSSGVTDSGAVNVIYGSSGGLSTSVVLDDQIWHQNSSGIGDAAEIGDGFGSAIGVGDFNDDGFADLAVGVPFEDVNGHADAGAVNVIYGSPAGLINTNDQIWHQDSPGIINVANGHELFGSALTVGDFDGDGVDDLAIGNPGEASGNQSNSGAVSVLYGTSGIGLTANGDHRFHQNATGVPGTSEDGDRYGFSLTSGDYNNDGYADLVIGIPTEDVGGIVDAGAINVIFGSDVGLDSTNANPSGSSQVLTQASTAFGETVEHGDRFGFSLASGNFDAHSGDDLAVGVPFEDVGDVWDAGMVQVTRFRSGSKEFVVDSTWHQDVTGVNEVAEVRDLFGFSLAAGNVGNSVNADDLVIGIPNEGLTIEVQQEDGTFEFIDIHEAGAISVIYGNQRIWGAYPPDVPFPPAGLDAANDDFRHQNSPGINDAVEDRDNFGTSVAIGHFTGSAFASVAIGVPLENVGGNVNAGAVNVINGSSGGLTNSNDRLFHQDLSAIDGAGEVGDRYGSMRDTAIFSTYDIELEFTAEVDATVRELSREAADRWREIVLGDVNDVVATYQRLDGALVVNAGIDDIRIRISYEDIDGTGNGLARAWSSPNWYRNAGAANEFLPFYSEIEIDAADLNDERLFGIIVHETGHSLGFNTVTLEDSERVRQIDLDENTFHIYDRENSQTAIAEFNQIFGTDFQFILMSQNADDEFDGHWHEDIMGNELLTPNADDGFMPISRITTGAFADLGYDADLDAADLFIPDFQFNIEGIEDETPISGVATGTPFFHPEEQDDFFIFIGGVGNALMQIS